jgi:hypothetical protein
MLRRWAAAQLDISEDTIKRVEFEHEGGYTNESGTDWPDEYFAVVYTYTGLRHVTTPDYESLPKLLAEILEHGDA